jgi:hypothetical protein
MSRRRGKLNVFAKNRAQSAPPERRTPAPKTTTGRDARLNIE